jgi:3-oxoacyl-[acyl-carrier-protein] synthase II
MKRRVVITAVGVVSSLGKTPAEIQDSLRKGQVDFERPAYDQEVVVSPIKDFDLRAYTGPFKERRYLNRGAGFSLAAAREAIRDSGLAKEDLGRAGLFVGAGPHLDIGGEFPAIENGNMDRDNLEALWILRFLPNTAASVIAQSLGIHGENLTVGTACAASLSAIGEAYRRIRDGYLDCALAGGGDSRLYAGGILAYKKAGALYRGEGKPEEASRPFDHGRKGFVSGEGGAFFLLQEWEHARERKANIWGEIAGYGNSIDGYRMTAPAPDGKAAAGAVRKALQEAGVIAGEVDFIVTHGTGTVLNDQVEAKIIRDVFPGETPAVIALKSWTGHLSTACGAVELAIALAAQAMGYLPAIRNLEHPCAPGIDFVRQGRQTAGRVFLIENFGFGGQNAALVIKKCEQ